MIAKNILLIKTQNGKTIEFDKTCKRFRYLGGKYSNEWQEYLEIASLPLMVGKGLIIKVSNDEAILTTPITEISE